MIYADTSFLFSLYAWDANTGTASTAYAKDARRPLLLTPWQLFELRNVIRLISGKLKRAGRPVPFQAGNIFKQVRQDLMAGRLRHAEPDGAMCCAWRNLLALNIPKPRALLPWTSGMWRPRFCWRPRSSGPSTLSNVGWPVDLDDSSSSRASGQVMPHPLPVWLPTRSKSILQKLR